MTIGMRYLVSGRVQGVFFRAFTRDMALNEGLTGTVRNLSDGRVEAYVEGPVDAVERFGRALMTGPPKARVDAVTSTEETPGGVRDFRVVR